MGTPDPGAREDVADDVDLGVGVVVHVAPVLLGEPPLLRGVERAVLGIDAKPVAEIRIVADLGTVVLVDVQAAVRRCTT
ncbi:MAG TPA: hypothetical protein VES21_04160 [Nocardioidaceae bacterium]|nr:hypothetical protein [Nocardioidaceae bacterium]